MYLPAKYLLKAINTKVKALGYSVTGVNTFPRVEVYDFNTTPTGEKVNKQWVVTFLFDIVTNKSDSSDGYTILEAIRNDFDSSLSVSKFQIYIWVWEQHTEIQEATNNNDVITRQLQRVRVELQEI